LQPLPFIGAAAGRAFQPLLSTFALIATAPAAKSRRAPAA
jgi:hypothetical protein